MSIRMAFLSDILSGLSSGKQLRCFFQDGYRVTRGKLTDFTRGLIFHYSIQPASNPNINTFSNYSQEVSLSVNKAGIKGTGRVLMEAKYEEKVMLQTLTRVARQIIESMEEPEEHFDHR